MKFGERIREQRKIKNMTQEDVAKHLHVSRKTISSWENENSYPDIKSLVKISDLYQISLDTLLNEDSGLKEYLQKDKVQSNYLELKYGISALGSLAITLLAVMNNATALVFFIGIVLVQAANNQFMKKTGLESPENKKSILKDPNARTSVKILTIFLILIGIIIIIWMGYISIVSNTVIGLIVIGIYTQIVNLFVYIIDKFHLR
ncbi:helix-turn-helix transcriptional regulator [Lactobacillus sp. B3795]|uniref:helix-turn-helix domain-containing protein n=1 Tax=Lactobacillus sp. B3795 TaxID=2818036 RepID=UPI00265D5763|nr:helix-turn-helix transcriptional regulator [Lactobacillus sp. B3795]MCX8743738.1 helix-turn-helix transcriptional regulator [Lactobacillus sp. B3795]